MKTTTISIILGALVTLAVGFFLFGKRTAETQETVWKGTREVYGSAVAIDPVWKVHAIWRRTNPFADHVGPFEYTFRWQSEPTPADVTKSIPPPLAGKWECVRLTYVTKVNPIPAPETPKNEKNLVK